MAEPRRIDAPTERGTDADRDGRAESLLLEGLDAYFAGRHDQAIHIWTRVLFVDRAHARARAYIDRARTALAERQRRSDEMLQHGQTLLDQGDTDAARELLMQVTAAVGDDERAAALRVRLERVERAHASPHVARTVVTSPAAMSPARRADPAMPWRPIAVVLLLASGIAALTVFLTGSLLPQWLDFRARPVPAAPAVTGALQVPGSAEVAVIRARSLYANGQLADALKVLDRVSAESPFASEAGRLRVEIERLLLAAGPLGPRTNSGAILR